MISGNETNTILPVELTSLGLDVVSIELIVVLGYCIEKDVLCIVDVDVGFCVEIDVGIGVEVDVGVCVEVGVGGCVKVDVGVCV